MFINFLISVQNDKKKYRHLLPIAMSICSYNMYKGILKSPSYVNTYKIELFMFSCWPFYAEYLFAVSYTNKFAYDDTWCAFDIIFHTGTKASASYVTTPSSSVGICVFHWSDHFLKSQAIDLLQKRDGFLGRLFLVCPNPRADEHKDVGNQYGFMIMHVNKVKWDIGLIVWSFNLHIHSYFLTMRIYVLMEIMQINFILHSGKIDDLVYTIVIL